MSKSNDILESKILFTKHHTLTIILTVFLISILIVPHGVAITVVNPVDSLKSLGIDVHYINNIPSGYITTKRLIENKYLNILNVNNYSTIEISGANGTISEPGSPSLPYKAYLLKLPGYIPKSKIIIGVSDLAFHIASITKDVMPVPQPLFYLINSSAKELVIKKNPKIYSLDKYFPGKVLDYYTGYGNQETIVVIRFYPVQYNPVHKQLIVIDKASVVLAYPKISSKTPASSSSYVILTTNDLIDSVSKLALFYNSTLGIATEVVSVEWINKTFPPAENITMYPGFYSPIYISDYDYVYQMLNTSYNYELALKIISYLRNETLHPYLGGILIVGDAASVPPSFYYQWMDLYPYYPWNSWIPTDFFYSSPDYDLVPNYVVGRIPFSDPTLVNMTIDKIISWYNATLSNSSWTRNMVLAGGYPFGYFFMLGEAVLSNITMSGYTSMFNTTLQMRTSFNYNNVTVKETLSNGGAIWYTLICHGSGNMLLDLLISESGYKYSKYEVLATSDDLLTLPQNSRIPVITSVACMNAAWDEAILPSFWFTPPSFGEAVLMSSGGGIAYIGSSRIAAEILWPPKLINGLLSINYKGAAWMHTMLINAYNSFMGATPKIPLGQVHALGSILYLATAGIGTIQLATIFETALLGDPMLMLPVFSEPFTTSVISGVEPSEYSVLLPASVIYYGCTGNFSFYKISQIGKLSVLALGDKGEAIFTRVYFYPLSGYLRGYNTTCTKEFSIEDGVGRVSIEFNKLSSGLILAKINVGGIEARFYLSAAGVVCKPMTVENLGAVSIEGHGLDLILSPYLNAMNLYVAGRYIATIYPTEYGYVEWQLSLPYLSPGSHPIIISPLNPVTGTEILMQYLSTYINTTFTKKLEVIVSLGSFYEPNQTANAYILTLLDGLPVNVTILNITLVTPSGLTDLEYKCVDTGKYLITFTSPSDPGIYTLVINAVYEAPFIIAEGSTTKTLTVTQRFLEISEKINTLTNFISEYFTNVLNTIASMEESISKSIESGVNSLSSQISSLSSNINNLENELLQKLSDLSTQINKQHKTLGTYIVATIAITILTLISSILTPLITRKTK